MTEAADTEMSSEDDTEEPSLQPLEAAPPMQGLDDDADSSSMDLPDGVETTTGSLPNGMLNLLNEPGLARRDSVCSDISTHEVL